MENESPMSGEHIDVGLKEKNRQGVVETLNLLLADETVLYIKTRKYHWNVVGPRFNDLHKFFEEQYTLLETLIDDVAENARQFGGFALGTMAEYTEIARLKEEPGFIPTDEAMICNLLEDHEAVIRELRPAIKKADEDYEAADAADFLTAVLEIHNKMAWMLRAFLPRPTGNPETQGRLEKVLAGHKS